MILCLHCKRFSSSGAIYCTSCSRSFGVKRCASGHPSAPGARYCGLCRSDQLSEATGYIPLGCLPLALTFGTVALIWRFAWTHLGLILSLAWRLAMQTLSIMFASCPRALEQGAVNLILWFGILYVVSGCLPGELGKQARALLLRLPKTGTRLLFEGLRLLYRTFIANKKAISEKSKKK